MKEKRDLRPFFTHVHKITWKAVITGSIIDLIGTNILIFVYSFVFFLTHSEVLNKQMNSYDLVRFLFEESLPQLLIMGVMMSMVAGVIVALIAKRHELLNTVASYVLTLILVLALNYVNPQDEYHLPIWYKLIGYVITPVGYVIGGYIGLSVKRRKK